MRAYSTDLRQRVAAAYDARQGTQEQVAARMADNPPESRDPLTRWVHSGISPMAASPDISSMVRVLAFCWAVADKEWLDRPSRTAWWSRLQGRSIGQTACSPPITTT